MAKHLSEMSDEERWKLFPIIITEYNPDWPELYLKEKAAIEKAVNLSNIFMIHHFGSTSIPGIYAKPTIDILLEVNEAADTNELIVNMQNIGYIYSPQEDNPPPHQMFLKGYTPEGFNGQVFHVHVRYPGDWNELYFRDYLILHPHIAKEYGELKLKLKEIHEFNRDAYTKAKSEFIKKVSIDARKELGSKYLLVK